HSIVKSLLALKKANKIDSFWTRDGRIFVKHEKETDPVRIKPSDDVETKLKISMSEAGDANEGSVGAMDIAETVTNDH
ncbi:MAG: hypothetical protein LC437_08845, partial [Thiohalomonas sp.]|nr:hypothetical protein [Thiohalomonas sp.]